MLVTREQLLAEKARRQKMSIPPSSPKEPEITPKKSSALDTAGHAALGGLHGVSYGAYPKAVGAAGAAIYSMLGDKNIPKELRNLTWEQRQDLIRDMSRKADIEASERSPLAYGAANIAGSLAAPTPLKGIGLAGALKKGAAYGAAYGAGTTDTGLSDTATSAGMGALTGAPLGAAGHYLSSAISPLAKRLPKTLRDLVAKNRQKPNQEALDILALAEKEGIPLSEAQVTKDFGKAWQEEEARLGKRGIAEQIRSKNLANIQKEKLAEYMTNIESQVGGRFTEKGAHAREGLSKITDAALEEKKAIKEAYDIAKLNISSVSRDDVKVLPRAIRQNLEDEVIHSPIAQQKVKFLNDMIKKSEDLPLNRMEMWRKGVNRSLREVPRGGEDEAGLTLVKREYDKWLDEVIQKSLNNGDEAALEQFKKARSLRAEFGKKYSASHSNEFGKKFVAEMIDITEKAPSTLTNENVVNRAFGASKLGFDKGAANVVMEIEKLSPEAGQQFKLEATRKILAPLFEGEAVRYSNNLKDLLKNQPALMRSIFTTDQITQLKDAGRLGMSIHVPPKSRINPSGSAHGLIAKSWGKIMDLPVIKHAWEVVRPTAIESSPDILRKKILSTPLVEQKTPLVPRALSQIGTTTIMDSMIDNKERLSQERSRVSKKRGGNVNAIVMTKRQSLLDTLRKIRGEQ
jgi:hypothetical protein